MSKAPRPKPKEDHTSLDWAKAVVIRDRVAELRIKGDDIPRKLGIAPSVLTRIRKGYERVQDWRAERIAKGLGWSLSELTKRAEDKRAELMEYARLEAGRKERTKHEQEGQRRQRREDFEVPTIPATFDISVAVTLIAILTEWVAQQPGGAARLKEEPWGQAVDTGESPTRGVSRGRNARR